MKIYISLPISGQSPEIVESRATFAAGVLEAKGHVPVNPIELNDWDDSYSACMGRDIAELLECDAIVLLEGWESSKGCRLEKACAAIYGKPIFYGLESVAPI